MGILNKLFGKRQQPSSSDAVKVKFNTKKKLSKEQKNAIITIVEAGIKDGEEPSTIAILISMNTDICDSVILQYDGNGVLEVII